MLSVVLSIAVGASLVGAVKGVIWTSEGRKGARVERQEFVMLWVELGFTRRMLIGLEVDIVGLSMVVLRCVVALCFFFFFFGMRREKRDA